MQTEIWGNFVENNLAHYYVLFNFGHIRRWDQCADHILYSKISTDPGLLSRSTKDPALSSVCFCDYTDFNSIRPRLQAKNSRKCATFL